jgi:hypothetical protein
LGFHATVGLLALVTAIAGAVSGANLMLVLFDMSRAWSAGAQLAAETTVDVRRPDVEVAGPHRALEKSAPMFRQNSEETT